MLISQVSDLFLSLSLQPIVPSTLIPLLIFLPQIQHTDRNEYNNCDSSCKIDGVSGSKVRCFTREVCPDAEWNMNTPLVQSNLIQTYAMIEPIAPIPGIAAAAIARIVSGAALSTPQV
jgi:hypothetical protein